MENKCIYANKCGACDFISESYQQELQEKKKTIEELLAKNNIKTPISDVVSMYYPYNYRNNVHLALSQEGRNIKIGFYERGSKNIIDIKSCLIYGDWLTKLIFIIRTYVLDFKIKCYDGRNRSGILRYVAARNFKNNIIVTLVATTQNFPGKEDLYRRLKSEFNEVSLWININNRTDSAVFDKSFFYKYGEKRLNASIAGVKFSILPGSFIQTNYEIANKIYKKVLKEVLDSKCTSVLDLFSGIGITSCLFGKAGLDVLSIEAERSSVKDAIELKKENRLDDKITCLCGRCEDLLPEIKSFCERTNVCAFVDPARDGINKDVLDVLNEACPKKIIYMSCNVETQIRDLNYFLKKNKYQINSINLFDMFPKTNHVETIVLLEAKQAKK